MILVRVEYSDGNYWLRRTEKGGPGVIAVGPELWERYEKHCADARFWGEIIRHMDEAGRAR